MKTYRFKEKKFGKTQKIDAFNVLDFICLATTWSGTYTEKDGTVSLMCISLDNRGKETFVDYRIENEKEGTLFYKLRRLVNMQVRLLSFL